MVKALIKVSPNFHNTFNKVVPLEFQKEIAMKSFKSKQKEWYRNERLRIREESLDPQKAANRELIIKVGEMLTKEDFGGKAAVKPTKGIGRKFYETKRKYTHLVPLIYKRTRAPRITATGSTLHGMKKDLSSSKAFKGLEDAVILKQTIGYFQQKGYHFSIIDLDMSAAHARFAIALQKSKETQLYQAVVNSGKFWDEKAEHYHKLIEAKSINLTRQNVRAMLKVALYTTLNGGNPLGVPRLFKSLEDQNECLIGGFTTLEEFEKSTLYSDLKGIFNGFELLHEVKELNKSCVTDDKKKLWTPDSTSPYYIDSVHKGISRALQSFEIILLVVLVKFILQRGGLPINLAHDGAMAIFPGFVNEADLVNELSEDVKPWAHYLLDDLSLPIECKFNLNTQTDYSAL